jgi:hypothetical protein
VQQLTKAIEKETGFTSVQIAVHRDEGHINERGIAEHNLHAHVTFFTLDQNTGQQLYRKSITPKQAENQPNLKPMNRARLSELQTLTAKELGMQRGKEGSNAVRMGHKEFKQSKQNELAKQKDLKAVVAELRADLKAMGAERKQYAVLEGLNRELKAQIKAKDLSKEGLEKKLEEYLNKHTEKNNAISGLEAKISDLEALGGSESARSFLEENLNNLDTNTDILLEFDMPLPKATNLLGDSWSNVDGQGIINISKTKAFIGKDNLDEENLAKNIDTLLSQARKLKEERDIFYEYSKKLKNNLDKIKSFMQNTKNKFKQVKAFFFRAEKAPTQKKRFVRTQTKKQNKGLER